jgi:hypothetical protein
VAAVVARARITGRNPAPDELGLGLLALADFLALGLVFRDTRGWLTLHGILACEALAGWMLVLTAWQRARVLS